MSVVADPLVFSLSSDVAMRSSKRLMSLTPPWSMMDSTTASAQAYANAAEFPSRQP